MRIKKPICPYCGGAMRIVVCDDEGNIKRRPNEYLKNPWSGVTYGIQHNLKDVPGGCRCPIANFDEDDRLIGTRLYDTEYDAHKALEQLFPRFPRKPIALEDIFSHRVVFIETALGGAGSQTVCYPAFFNMFDQNAFCDSVRYVCFGSETRYSVRKSEYGKAWRCWDAEPTKVECSNAEWLHDPFEVQE